MAATRVPNSMRPAAASGWAQWRANASIPGTATQWASWCGSAASATRPCASSTRTALALQGLHTPGAVARARPKRGSRTVKYWEPGSKLPKAVSVLAMRPPTLSAFSNSMWWIMS